MRQRLRIGGALSWVLAWLLALAALAGVLLWPSIVMLWVMLVLLTPLIGLAAWRHDKQSQTDEYYGFGDGGPSR